MHGPLSTIAAAAWLSLCAGALAAEPPAPPASPVTLRPSVTVEGPTVRLSDIFLGVERDAAAIVAAAPPPGERVVLEARWLDRVARAYRVNWQPTSRLDRVSLVRASQVLDRPRIDALIQQALAKDGVAGELEIELDGRLPEIQLPVDAEEPASLARLQFDRRTMRFTGVLLAPANHPESRRYSIAGRAHEQAMLPALGRRVAPGEMIEERDLVWTKVRADLVGPTTLTEVDQIVGLSPKRVLQPNRALVVADIEAPILVKKNSIVTVTFRHPGMELTAKAKATSNGTLGDTISVINIASNKSIEAVVVGRGSVAIGPGARPRLAYNNGN
ncbi:MAG: flagellar basal body P-ring formation protein FlgA [Alphaproteobacteria bacterium]|nr:flagellar basal body P-ring formation protein FlgA [Alphaproteobacteria bacterium]